MRCGQRHGAPVRSARPPPAECEYDEVWTCERGLSVLPVTTGHPPHVFQMRFNQQEGVLVLGLLTGIARRRFGIAEVTDYRESCNLRPGNGGRRRVDVPFEAR